MPPLNNPRFWSLQWQLVVALSLGAVCTLSAVVLLGTLLFVRQAGNDITSNSLAALQLQVQQRIVSTSTAQTLQQAWFQQATGTVQLATEMIQDRIVGYSDRHSHDNNNNTDTAPWIQDTLVPFWDVETQSNKYPLQPKPLPWLSSLSSSSSSSLSPSSSSIPFGYNQRKSYADWHKHFQKRRPGYYAYIHVSTVTSAFYSRSSTVSSPHTQGLHDKSAAIGALFKALWELQQQPAALTLTLHYKNQGYGARVQFPAVISNNTNSSSNTSNTNPSYTSVGCD